MQRQLRVVMTGAAGTIGTAVAAALDGRWDLELTDLGPGTARQLDVTDGDACLRAFSGADAVVHLAANPSPAASWEELWAPNLVGAYQVANAAMTAGVPRLVLASSLQAVAAYPASSQRRASDAPRPDNLYGATKAWAEALGSWVGARSTTTVVALRIGYFAAEAPAEARPESRSGWLSARDCAELVRCAVEAPVRGFVVVNGISANRHPGAELAEAATSIGYQPTDDAWA
jgi:nucleoside-diphosphate-sugar epimerase